MTTIQAALREPSNHSMCFAMVSEMNNAFNNKPFKPEAINLEKLRNQCKNIADEVRELRKAINKLREMPYTDYSQPPTPEYVKHFEELRDALCDIIVFTMGGVHFMGMWHQYDMINAKLIDAALTTMDIPMPHGPLLDNNALDTLEQVADSITEAHKVLMEHLNDDNPFLKEFDGHSDMGQAILAAAAAINMYAMTGLTYVQAGIVDDMQSVIDGVMSRFIKNDEDLEATKAAHAKIGITDVVLEGEYPNAILRSASDQPDAPAGKFLKSASYRKAVFQDIISAYVMGMAARGAEGENTAAAS